MVQGEDIGQTFQFVRTGNAELGFVAWAQVKAEGETGSCWLVPESLHQPVEQQAVLLARARDEKAARAFLDFLRGKPAREIIARAGYSH
jgi:molybdate transport system substrate-binding protein